MSVQALVTAAKRALGGKPRAEATDVEVMNIDALPWRPTIPPAVDVFERQEETIIVLDVPGATRRSTEVTVTGDRLEVLARRSDTRDADARDWRRRFVMTNAVDSDRIRADVRDGVLTIRLPMRAAVKSRKVPVGRPRLSWA